MERYPAGATAPVLVLAHGAGAGEHHPWMLHVARGLVDRGVSVVTFEFPYMQARRGRPDAAPVLEAAFRTAWDDTVAATGPGTRWFAGGKSMGGRIASQVAAARGFSPAPGGLVFFGYPLHPPDAPAKRRDAHLPQIDLPMLFLHGTRDPFGTPEEMRTLTSGLRSSTLHLAEGGDHSLQRSKKWDTVDAAIEVAAHWILRVAVPI